MTDQAQLPGWCWTCMGEGTARVAATAIDCHGDRYCIEEELPCRDCRPRPLGFRASH